MKKESAATNILTVSVELFKLNHETSLRIIFFLTLKKLYCDFIDFSVGSKPNK